MTVLLVAALAAALVGGFTSFPLTLLGSMAIAVVQAELEHYVRVQGLSDALPVIVITVLLMFRGNALPVRGQIGERLAELGSGKVNLPVVGAVTGAFGLLMLLSFSQALNAALGLSLIMSIILLSIVVLTGYCGQLSLAQLPFGGLAALIAGRLIISAHWPFLLAAPAGIIAVIPIGLLFGLPALRTRGLTLAIVTFGLGTAITQMVINRADVIGTEEPDASWLDVLSRPCRYGSLIILFAFVLLALTLPSQALQTPWSASATPTRHPPSTGRVAR